MSPLLALILGSSIGVATFTMWRIDVFSKQREYDLDRNTYELIHPSGLTEESVKNYAHAIGNNLDNGLARFQGVPTISFEVWATDRGISHRHRVPALDAGYIIDQLEEHLDGIDILPLDDVEDPTDERLEPTEFTFGMELFMTNPVRTLRIYNSKAHSAKILRALQTDQPDETVVLQWIISHSTKIKAPDSGKAIASRPTFWQALIFGIEPSKDEVADRRAKAVEQQFAAVGRIAAVAETEKRAKQLVMKVLRAIQSENHENKIYGKPIPANRLYSAMNDARTPMMFGNQLTVSELIALVGWPIGDPKVPGLRQGSARRIAPTEAVARSGGRNLGWSNVSGSKKRPVHLSYEYTDLNCIYAGMIGSGKSVGMANAFYDDVQNGYGAIVIDASESRSPQSLASRAVDYIPHHRINDTLFIDVQGNADHPIGFNLFDQGLGRGAIDQIVGVFTSLYPDIAQGVSVRDLLYHGVWTLVDHGGLTLVDLGALIRPNNPAETAWADEVIKNVKDPDLRDFWERIAKTGRGNPKKASEWERYTDPLYRRLWQLLGRPEIRNMIGQTKSALVWEDILKNNKIVIISLSGLPRDSAELLGSLLTQTLWSSVQRLTPDKGNGLYLDEFQITSNIKEGLDDMLNRGRKHKLWTTLGTQFLSDLPAKTKNAIYNNVGTRVIYRTSADEALMWRRQFASDQLKESDFQQARPHEAIVQLPTGTGRSIVTIKALPPAEPMGTAHQVILNAIHQYGKPVEAVRQEIIDRRKPTKTVTRNEPAIGWEI